MKKLFFVFIGIMLFHTDVFAVDCDESAHLVSCSGEDACCCMKGYYKDESDNTCHQCQSGKTTEGTGAEGEGSCKWLFKYKNGDEYKTWDWPGEVDEGNIIVGSVHGL